MSSINNQENIDVDRLIFLDALRGIAALYVILFHLVLIPDFKIPYPNYLHGFLMSGFSGVTLFFILSAFTLCLTGENKLSSLHGIKNFYIRRILRIVPLYYIWLFIVIFFYKVPYNFNQLFLYSTFTYNFFPYKQEGIVWASWTLGIEMIFYFLFPFLFHYVNTLKKSVYFFIFSIITMLIHYNYTYDIDGYITKMGLLHQLPVFAIGFIVFFIYKEIKRNDIKKEIGNILIFISLCLFFFHNTIFSYLKFAEFLGKAISYAVLFLGLYLSPLKIIVNRFTSFIGKISFSMYLNHSKLVFALSPLYELISKYTSIQEFGLVISFFITCILLIPISIITYKYIEKLSINLARRLTNNNYSVFKKLNFVNKKFIQ